ncbi:putative restriction endonuclease [Asanoa hainanensis]|uniref:Putative restriction endonuclease n=1 Tax=Asanoa hainanensis TaxID=560556 RepID=A0A239P325_9ACTN|nr:HNH endonuclease [Asanoa hainanensis]SNT61113.1 putative restriction endonuclease [Asanoa hainanensis]
MPSVADYLEVSVPAARAQWRAIRLRRPVSGGRQVDFTPVETLLCLAAGLLVNRRRYGGKSAHRAEEPLPTLARLFARSNGSLLAKMANLEGSWPNGAKHEVEVAATLLADPERLVAVYRLLLRAARAEGLTTDDLPDFLGLEPEDTAFVLLGQEELSHGEIESDVAPLVGTWAEKRPDVATVTTEKLLVAAVRVGQHQFATKVLRNHGHRCAFCGLRVDIDGGRAPRMLVASHIKPWAKSTASERLDVRNGLAACPTHDAAFDTGLLTVNGGLRIHVKPELRRQVKENAVVAAAFGSPPLAEKLLLPDGSITPAERYLAYHHANIYRLDLGWAGKST